jgi:hypothetical protein
LREGQALKQKTEDKKMKITDGKKTVEIKIMKWNGNGYDPDWSMDYFEAGSLPYNEETDCYTVEDVDYCIEMAKSADEDGACGMVNEEGEIARDEDMVVVVEEA